MISRVATRRAARVRLLRAFAPRRVLFLIVATHRHAASMVDVDADEDPF
jgi:hypothetical protein